jgi:mRNA-degrading endonuclease RelE of RelBE toxin-antitoxin system
VANLFELKFTSTFSKDIDKLTKRDSILKKKLVKALEKLKLDPYQGERVEASGLEERRIWVGDGHRLFYDIDGKNIVLLHLKKKDKHTYRI